MEAMLGFDLCDAMASSLENPGLLLLRLKLPGNIGVEKRLLLVSALASFFAAAVNDVKDSFLGIDDIGVPFLLKSKEFLAEFEMDEVGVDALCGTRIEVENNGDCKGEETVFVGLIVGGRVEGMS